MWRVCLFSAVFAIGLLPAAYSQQSMDIRVNFQVVDRVGVGIGGAHFAAMNAKTGTMIEADADDRGFVSVLLGPGTYEVIAENRPFTPGKLMVEIGKEGPDTIRIALGVDCQHVTCDPMVSPEQPIEPEAGKDGLRGATIDPLQLKSVELNSASRKSSEYQIEHPQASHAGSLRIRTLDQTGAPLPDQLVIVRSLDEPKELFRFLTEKDGKIPASEIAPGLYRLIITNPYGAFQTVIQEFTAGFSPVELNVKVPVAPTHGEGDRVIVRTMDSVVPQVRIRVIDEQGKPVPAVAISVRNLDLDFEHWYRTNDKGERKVELPEAPITILAYWQGKLKSIELNDTEANAMDGKVITIQFK